MSATMPSRTITMLSTLASTGRSMKNAAIMARPAMVAGCGATFWFGTARWVPVTMTWSSGPRPLSMTRSWPTSGPVVTRRCCTVWSASTTST